MGSVFRARDRATGATVAVKFLRHEAVHAARFKREAELLATLDHPSIVRYVAHGGPPAYIAMEWLEGQSLHERIRQGELSVLESISVVRQTAKALAAAHRRGVVHRDV